MATEYGKDSIFGEYYGIFLVTVTKLFLFLFSCFALLIIFKVAFEDGHRLALLALPLLGAIVVCTIVAFGTRNPNLMLPFIFASIVSCLISCLLMLYYFRLVFRECPYGCYEFAGQRYPRGPRRTILVLNIVGLIISSLLSALQTYTAMKCLEYYDTKYFSQKLASRAASRRQTQQTVETVAVYPGDRVRITLDDEVLQLKVIALPTPEVNDTPPSYESLGN